MSRTATQLSSTSKARTCTGLTVWVSLVALTVLAALPIQRLGEQANKASAEFAMQKSALAAENLWGGYYQPKDPKVASDLSDWSLLHFEEGDITSVRMVGRFHLFTDLTSNDEKIDVTTTTPVVLRTFEQALDMYLALRPGTSDIISGGIRNGGGEHQGVFAVTTKSKGTFIIGIGCHGFYLGIGHGGERQRFWSAALARQVDELLFEATGKRVPEEYLYWMTGQRQIDQSEEVFRRNRISKTQ
jgi:hypothetical protein